MEDAIKLYGFNNLTKTLSFNLYDVCYAMNESEQKNYLAYINEQYHGKRLAEALLQVADTIGAHVLNISKQNYDPLGASVNLLIAEEAVEDEILDLSCNRNCFLKNQRETVHGHLDKSHITVHTYPESFPDNHVVTFRADIDVSTCGQISPLNALDYLLTFFDSDIVIMDYRIRGFTRDETGKKRYIDHKINSIQDFISPEILERYICTDTNLYEMNNFQTKLRIKDINLNNYLFQLEAADMTEEEQATCIRALKREMKEIYYGMNID